MSGTVRADKWLWAVRLFKTRGKAAEACASGKVKRRGSGLKAASFLQAGDELEVPYPEGPGVRRLTVTSLIDQRVGAPAARECYRDQTPQQELDMRAAWQRNRSEGMRGRPSKKDRREMNRMRGFFD